MNSKIFNKLEDSISGVILDSRSVKWGDFQFTNGYTKHYVSEGEQLKPYLISYTYYGTVDYEDEILLINNVQDPYTIVAGMELKIPMIQDIKQFILDNRK